MEGNINAYLNRLYEIIAYDEKKRTHYEYLRENTYNLFLPRRFDSFIQISWNPDLGY